MTYCFDTSAFMDSYIRWHPPDIFPCVWTEFENAIQSGIIISPYLVLGEMKKKASDLAIWADNPNRWRMFIENNDKVQELIVEILQEFRDTGFVNMNKIFPQADPDVIALAFIRRIPVVTGEKPQRKDRPSDPIKNPHKIPDVCKHYGVEWMNIVDFMREQEWVF